MANYYKYEREWIRMDNLGQIIQLNQIDSWLPGLDSNQRPFD
jgi:hypothetical protein